MGFVHVDLSGAVRLICCVVAAVYVQSASEMVEAVYVQKQWYKLTRTVVSPRSGDQVIR